MTEPDEEPIPISWTEKPEVSRETKWVKDGESQYPMELVYVNGALLTPEDADKLRHELSKVLQQ